MCAEVCPCIQGCIAIFGCSRDIENDISNLRQDRTFLKDNRPTLENKIRRVEERCRNGAASSPEKTWLGSAREEKALLDHILGSQESPNDLPSHCLCCHLYCCGNLRSGMRERRDRLQSLLHPLEVRTTTVSVVPLATVEMIGMPSKFQEFWRLFDEENAPQIIGIHGLPGSGKSTFLMNVNNAFIDDLRRFEKVIYVDCSYTRDIEAIQSTIAERLGLESRSNIRREVRGGVILRELNRTDFVLLLDNLPDGLELTAIGVPYPPTPGNQKRCKIVFAARMTGIWSNLSPPPKPFDLGLLDRQSAIELFRSKAGIPNSNTGQQADACHSARPTIPELADTIVDICSGLPFSLVTVGTDLLNKHRARWEETTERLKCPESAGAEPSVYKEVEVYEYLSSAYESLVSREQNCLLYCCLFPGGQIIKEEELKHHWVAEGFLGNIDDLRTCLEIGDSALDTLKRALLLMSSKDEPAVEMHLQIYNMARWISSGHLPRGGPNKIYVQATSSTELKELPVERDWSQLERISLLGTTIWQLNRIGCSRLSTLILKHCNITNISSGFFDPMKEELKVLNLSESTLPAILSGIAVLTSLRYLNVSRSNIQELPREFGNLRKLIILDLSYTEQLEKIAANVLRNLSDLEWLNMYYCSVGRRNHRGSSSSPRELTDLLNEVHGLKRLRDLGITVRSIPALKKLIGYSHLTRNTHSILITECHAVDSPESTSAAYNEVNLSSIASITSLKELHIISCKASLRFQEPSRRTNLYFQNLRDIKIDDCWKTTDLTWLRHAHALEFLEIIRCPSLTNVIGVGGRGRDGAPVVQQNTHPFLNLKELHLEDLPLLGSICPQNLPFSKLMKITVLRCSKLHGISIDVNIARQELIPIICQRKWWGTNLDEGTKSKLFRVPN